MQVVLTQALSRAEEQARPGLWARVVGWGHDRWEAHRQQRRYRNTVRALSVLDDRTLHDIGLERSEITSYATRGGEGRHPVDRFMPRYITPMF
ncbi:MAG: DUF1127 domain-containing protein [Hyphomicrobium sp.]|nr:DUF1127 domain-containing protein [Hyphomicrobium sp.]MBN9266023.1 DUF1127 domain-containing protein [Hyphomicrobium sp.]